MATSRTMQTATLKSKVRLVGFRFLVAYLVFYILPFPMDSLPFIGEKAEVCWRKFWQLIVPWVGSHILRLSAENSLIAKGIGGSGDTLFEYVRLFCLLALALLATLAWSGLDGRRKNYARLNEWLHVALRYYLAIAMLSYGGIKVLRSQFQFPEPERWFQTYGNSSPMRLLWTFMGFSAPYTFFCGMAEVLSAFLLFFRRTCTLGALVAAAVLSNVVMLNYCYDVPVKIYSTHLLLVTLVLLLPDFQRLSDFFVLNRGCESRKMLPYFKTKQWNRASRIVKSLFIIWSVFVTGRICYENWVTHGDRAPRPDLYGAYEVETFAQDGKLLPPLASDTRRWRRFIVNRNSFTIQHMNDQTDRFQGSPDSAAGTLNLSHGTEKITLSYVRPETDRLILDGKLASGANIHVELRRRELGTLPLLKRGFHWLNEVPFNF